VFDELTEECDHLILMHREAHFGGDFGVMLDYYQQDRLGVQEDIEVQRIAYLAEVEKTLEKDLAPLMLSGSEAEAVARARLAYRRLKAIYDMESQENSLPRLLADLVLTEEEDPKQEIDAIVAHGPQAIPFLMELIKQPDSYDPLFPGYGYAPYFAMLCLGRLHATEAIAPIFSAMSEEGRAGEELVIEALKEMGAPAKEFLLKVVASRPLSQDNTHAAFALTAFHEDVDVAKAALAQLQDPQVRESPLLPIYLLCACDALKETPEREEFIALAEAPSTSERLREEIRNIAQDWE